MNTHLSSIEVSVSDLVCGLCDGVRLCQLVEILSGRSVGAYTKSPKMEVQYHNNLNIALNFLIKNEGIKLVNIGSSDIVGKNQRIILGLIWTLILKYQISHELASDADQANSHTGAKDLLLEWVRLGVCAG